MSELRKYATAAELSTILITAGSRNAQVNPTLASGDVQVSLDDAAFTNITTLPSVLPAGGVKVKISLSAAELTCQRLMIRFVDAAGAEWEEQTIVVETYGHASALHPNIAVNPVLSAQETRDAMALDTTVGTPAAGSIDDQLLTIDGKVDSIQSDVTTIDGKVDSIQSDVTTIDGKVDSIQTDVTTISTNVTIIDGKVDSIQSDVTAIGILATAIDGKVDSIQTDTTQIIADIAALAAVAALEATSQSILTNVGAIIAKLPATGLISNYNPATTTVDGMTYSYIHELVAALTNGRYAMDTPGPCDITFYKRDNLTPLTVVHVAQAGRTRLS